jgi:hypothetical protein
MGLTLFPASSACQSPLVHFIVIALLLNPSARVMSKNSSLLSRRVADVAGRLSRCLLEDFVARLERRLGKPWITLCADQYVYLVDPNSTWRNPGAMDPAKPRARDETNGPVGFGIAHPLPIMGTINRVAFAKSMQAASGMKQH